MKALGFTFFAVIFFENKKIATGLTLIPPSKEVACFPRKAAMGGIDQREKKKGHIK